jgi:prepilin peptidase CpaA
MTTPLTVAGSTVGIGILVAAALHDVAVRTVPNPMVAALGMCGLLLAALQHRLPLSLGMAAVLLGLAVLLWLAGVIGGADAKLFGATGLLVAPASLPAMLLATALAGGLLCLPYLPGRRLFARPAPGRPAGVAARWWRCVRWRLRRRGPLPYAVAIAAGTVFALLQGD